MTTLVTGDAFGNAGVSRTVSLVGLLAPKQLTLDANVASAPVSIKMLIESRAVRGEGITMMKSLCVALALSVVSISSTFASPAPTKTAEHATRVEISVTEKGFQPEQIKVPANKPVTLVFRRTTDKTCAKQVVIKISDTQKIEKDLPLNKTVEIAATFPKAGHLSYTCSMDMIRGTLTVL